MTTSAYEISLRLPDDPGSPAKARALLRELHGATTERTDDARLLLHELVAEALFEGASAVDVRVCFLRGALRFEVSSEFGDHRTRRRSPVGAARISRHLIRSLSDRSGRDDRSLWCELEGFWSFAAGRGPDRVTVAS